MFEKTAKTEKKRKEIKEIKKGSNEKSKNQINSPTGAFSSQSLCIYLYSLSVTETLYGVGFNKRLMSGRM